ncbi:MAG: zinc ribbon domain-containing protein, partial [Firmicutes bacterium]|nr:zinc ribbon domain-containing protein [Bacillota bacterium]
MLFNNENPDVLNLLEKIQEATTSDVDEERGSFKKGDKVTYNMLGGSLSNDDFIRTLGTNEHAIRVRHDGTIAEIVEAMGEEVARYSIQFTDGFIINDVAVSEVRAITEAYTRSYQQMTKEELKKELKDFHGELNRGFCAHPKEVQAEIDKINAELKRNKSMSEAEDATQTMKPQEKPALDAEDVNMEDYSEEDLNKPEAKVKSKSEKSGDAIRGVEDKELVQKDDKVVTPKNEAVSEGVPEKHQLKIAKDTLKMSDAGAGAMGGMNKKEARAFLKKQGWSDARRAKLEESKLQEMKDWACMECGHKFNKDVPKSGEMRCPKCHGVDIEPDSGTSEAKRKDHIPGGQGDKKVASDFNAEQVKIGTKIEMEHTDDPIIAGEIVLDHLKEDPEYYTKLVRMEAGACDAPKKES